MDVDTENEAFNLFFNCNNESIKELKSKGPINPEKVELSYIQNIFDFTFPYDIEIDFEAFNPSSPNFEEKILQRSEVKPHITNKKPLILNNPAIDAFFRGDEYAGYF